MRRSLVITLLFIVMVLPLSSAQAATGDAGVESLFSFGVGARPMGMGRAFVAVANDANALYWNPAGLPQLRRKEITALHTSLFEGTLYDFVGYAHPTLRLGTLGIGMIRLGTGDIEWRDEHNNLIKTFSAEQSEIIFSYGRQFSKALSLGLNFKVLNHRLSDYSATGTGFDLGLRYNPQTKFLGLNNLSLGLNLQDIIGAKLQLKDETDTMPLNIKGGLAYNINVGKTNALLATDFNQTKDRSLKMHFGGELTLLRMFSARAGLDDGRMTAGGGISFRGVQVDYAFVSHEDLETTHRFSFTTRFGWTLSEQGRREEEREAKRIKETIEKEVKEAVEQAAKENQALRTEIVELKRNTERNIGEIKVRTAYEMELAKMAMEKEIAQVRISAEREIAQAKLEAERRGAEARAQAEMEIEELKRNTEEEIRVGIAQEIEKAKKALEMEIAQAKAEAEKARIQAEREAAQAKLEAERVSAEARAKAERDIALMRESTERQVREIKERAEKEMALALSAKEGAEKRLAQLLVEAEKKIGEARAEAERKVALSREEAEKRIAEIKERAEKEIALSYLAKEEAEKKIKEIRAETDRRMALSQEEAERRIREIRERAEKEIALASSAKEEAERRVATIRAETDRIVAQIKNEAEGRTTQLVEEMERKIREARAEAERKVALSREEAERRIAEIKEGTAKEVALSYLAKEEAEKRAATIREEAERAITRIREEAERKVWQTTAEADQKITLAREEAQRRTAMVEEEMAKRIKAIAEQAERERAEILSARDKLISEKEAMARKQAAIEEHLRAGAQYFEAKKYLAAISALERVLEIDPFHKEAKESLEQARIKYNEEINTRLRKARAYYRENKLTEAIDEWNQVLNLDSNHKEARRSIIEASRRLLKVQHYVQGIEYFEAGKYESAIAEFKLVLSLDPNYLRANEYLQEALRKTRPLTPLTEEIRRRYYEGIDYYVKGEYEKAIRAWERILKEYPDNEIAINIDRNIKEAQTRLERIKR